MHYQKTYECDECGSTCQTGPQYDNDRMECHCGGTYRLSGEEYDQEFVEYERYQRERQDIDDRYYGRW